MAFARTPWFVKSFFGLDFMQSLLKFQVKLVTGGAKRTGSAGRTSRAGW